MSPINGKESVIQTDFIRSITKDPKAQEGGIRRGRHLVLHDLNGYRLQRCLGWSGHWLRTWGTYSCDLCEPARDEIARSRVHPTRNPHVFHFSSHFYHMSHKRILPHLDLPESRDLRMVMSSHPFKSIYSFRRRLQQTEGGSRSVSIETRVTVHPLKVSRDGV